MSLKDWKIMSFYFELIACIQYIILIITAMFFYTGGTESNPNVPGYSFWANSLSDLGRTISYSGQVNTVSMVLFSVALFIWAFSLIPFFIYLAYSVSETDLQRKISYIGQISGILAGIGLMGIVFTPDDLFGNLHMIFVIIGYLTLFIAGASYSIVMFLNKTFSRKYLAIFLIFTIIHFITSIIGLVALDSLRQIMVISQKIGRLTTVVCLALVSFGMARGE